MGPESIAAEWVIDSEAMISKIQLAGQKYRDKTTLASKTRFSRHCFGFQSRRFSLQVGYMAYSLVVAQPIRTQHRPLVGFY